MENKTTETLILQIVGHAAFLKQTVRCLFYVQIMYRPTPNYVTTATLTLYGKPFWVVNKSDFYKSYNKIQNI